jgi:sorting nexin-8
MWHELRVVLHNRENALVSKAIREFSREEASYSERVAQNWVALAENVDSMPLE